MSQKTNGEIRKSKGKQEDENSSTTKKDLASKKAQLTPMEYRVTQERQTERPYSNKYNRHWETGTYHCIVCDTELFRSNTKFESKSGWPAFSNVVDVKRVKLTPDLSHIGANLLLLITKPELARTEVSCSNCNAHLGHLFKDGPKPTGLRYCINSSSLNFVSGNGESVISPVEASGYSNGTNGSVETTNDKKKLQRAESQTKDEASQAVNNVPPMAMLCLNNKSSSTKSSSTTCQNMNSNNFVRGSSRYATTSCGGASLTAARISFFQQQAAQAQQSTPGTRTFGTPKNGSLSNRFVNSTSSGSLSSSAANTNGGISIGSSIKRRNSAGLFPNLTKVDQVSSAPKILVLRETSL